jgi:spectinomycin phosphotransferase
MWEKPDLPDTLIIACLDRKYGLRGVDVEFLPLGYDMSASVYKIHADDGTDYFLKLRSGPVNPTCLTVPRLLREGGVTNVVAPLPTLSQTLWCALDGYSAILYPFIEGENAKIVGMTGSHWLEFGAAMRAIHSGEWAAKLQGCVPVETFSLPCRSLIQRGLAAAGGDFESPAARQMASFWRDRAEQIETLTLRAEELGRRLQSKRFELVLCHADIHAANVLIGRDGGVHLVDWDGPLIAPRERDLLFVVGSRIARPVEPRQEALFFQAYGSVDVDWMALAYYRYERALEDIGERGVSVFFDMHLGEASREIQTRDFLRSFGPGSMVESAQEADRRIHS